MIEKTPMLNMEQSFLPREKATVINRVASKFY